MARSCGECTLCCKLMGIEELSKPVGEWCSHCDIGKGCKIYETRPPSCQTFRCMWLDQEFWPEDARPDRCGVLLFWPEERPKQIQAKCEPTRSNAWDRGAAKQVLHAVLNSGFDVLLAIGSRRKYLTLDKGTADDVFKIVKGER